MSVMRIRAAGDTNPGKVRPHNEDNFYMAQLNGSVGPAHIERYGHLFIVADGVGGNRGGARAAEIATTRIPVHYYAGQSTDAAANLSAALQATAREIRAEAAANPDRANMICTVVAAVILGDQVVIAHMGDARAYLMRDKRLRQLTKDHTWVQQQVENGTLTEAEAEAHPERNVITRALGNPTFPEAAVSQMRLNEGDQLLLCSDGLSGMAGAAEIAAVLADGSEPTPKPQRLIALANRKGGQDNITAVVIQAGKPGRKSSALPLLLGLMAVGVLGLGGWLVLGRSATEPSVAEVVPTAAAEMTSGGVLGGGWGSAAALPTSTLVPMAEGAAYPAEGEPVTPTPTQSGVAMAAAEPTLAQSYPIRLVSPGVDCDTPPYKVIDRNTGGTVEFQWDYRGAISEDDVIEVRFTNGSPYRIVDKASPELIPIDSFGEPLKEGSYSYFRWDVVHKAADRVIRRSTAWCFVLVESASTSMPPIIDPPDNGLEPPPPVPPTNTPPPVPPTNTPPPVPPTNTPTPVPPTNTWTPVPPTAEEPPLMPGTIEPIATP